MTEALKNIIVCAYPKSGSTWLTRLIAELIQCPAAGYWDDPRLGLVEEGIHRDSNYCCYQAHHRFEQLQLNTHIDVSIVYLVRDPRDVAISGAHYFEFIRFKPLYNLFMQFPKGEGLYHRIIKKISTSHQFCVNQMINAVLFGSSEVNEWCQFSWKSHVISYLNSNCLIIRYEDLIDHPKKECLKILDYLGLKRPESIIDQAIENQSFSRKKSALMAKGELFKAKHLHTGLVNQWHKGLTAKQKSMFIDHLKNELGHFSYSFQCP